MTLSIERAYANSTPLVLLIRVYFGNNSRPYPGVLPSKPIRFSARMLHGMQMQSPLFLDHTISFDLIGPYLHTHIVFVAACRGRLFKNTLTHVNLVLFGYPYEYDCKTQSFCDARRYLLILK